MDENKNFVNRFDDIYLMDNRKLHRKKTKLYTEVRKLVHSHAKRDEDSICREKVLVYI